MNDTQTVNAEETTVASSRSGSSFGFVAQITREELIMPEEVKKEVVKDDRPSITFLNRGSRTFDLGIGADGKPRLHIKGSTMVYTAVEADQHQGYPDLVDISKLPGVVDQTAIKDENAKLAAENAELKKQLAGLTPPSDTPVVVASSKRQKVSA
jgi:hypothetical protein